MLCWAVATPLLSGPDEGAHLVKATATVRGQLIGRPGDQPVLRRVALPEAYANLGVYPPCYAGDPNRSAACLRPLPADAGPTVTGQTYVIRYPPLFYAVAGWPTLVLPPHLAVLGVRVLASAPSALLCTAALMAAGRRRAAQLGVLTAVAPMALYLGGVTNPNGLEIAAALCLWSTGSALLSKRTGGTPSRGWMTTAFGLAGLVLALVRGTSVAWLVVILLALLAVDPRAAVARVRADGRLRGWLLADAVAALVGGAYVVAARALEVLRPVQGVDVHGLAAIRTSVGRIGYWAQGAIADFGWLDSPAPLLTYLLWAAALATLATLAALRGTRRALLVVAVLTVVTFAGAVLLEAVRLPEFGHGWQGRYMLPLLVGAPILLGRAIHSWERGSALVAGALVLGHVAAFWWCLRRFAVGLHGSLLGRHATWSPPLPLWLLLLAYLIAVGGFAAMTLRREPAVAGVG